MLLLLGLSNFVCAYPITPRPLRNLIIESEFIVNAKVLEIRKDDSQGHQSIAVLIINEVVQGEFKIDTIEVLFSPGMICPAPPRYMKGATVLVFLNKVDFGFKTVGLSYGLKNIKEESYNVYKSRILEMQSLNKLKESENKNSLIVDWLIKCALNNFTSWEGVYELTSRNFTKRGLKLSNHQSTILRNMVLDKDKISQYDIDLIELLGKNGDIELYECLIESVKVNGLQHLHYKEYLVSVLIKISNRDDLERIGLKIEKIGYGEGRAAKINQVVKEFLKLI